ncbi:mig2-4 protein [Mycosarcoma maydis]|uniref:Mig2-4 n=1 Tax=Mycosarcoma maydis TaxID=5270 RepID=Q8X1D5_MYCMD|nr:mig2-4 protein [Ustilago maydis 521]AAL67330.1 Mig2-4 [Ustilago maydis]KIS65800.1 mig2-4 protein [Ustilago maydis 521]|eukprot:XP_011392550.1 mig2-4 protein [Ustilago maydis 521]
MFFHKPLFLAASLSLFLCLFTFASAGRANGDQQYLRKRQSETSIIGRTEGPSRPVPFTSSPDLVVITSKLEILGKESSALGQCSCVRTLDDQKQNVSGTCTSRFVDSAKSTATCLFGTLTDATCFEKGGKLDLSDGDKVWWQKAFCKRCKAAGGKSHPFYACP